MRRSAREHLHHLSRWLPILRWLPELRAPGAWRADLFAGLTGAVVVLPQGVAFATLAGMPPEWVVRGDGAVRRGRALWLEPADDHRAGQRHFIDDAGADCATP